MWLLALPLADAAPRTLWFAGRTWEVKAGVHGPGPNAFSDSAESVWVDAQGALHLRLREIDGVWHSAEVRSTDCTRYGRHSFTVAPRPEPDPQVVLGIFLYADDRHEVDMEWTQWGDPSQPSLWWTVQPATAESQQTRAAPSSTQTARMTWRRRWVSFALDEGPVDPWHYRGPQTPKARDDLHIHINLWLFENHAPEGLESHEVVIDAAQLPRPRKC